MTERGKFLRTLRHYEIVYLILYTLKIKPGSVVWVISTKSKQQHNSCKQRCTTTLYIYSGMCLHEEHYYRLKYAQHLQPPPPQNRSSIFCTYSK